ncbi:hypothetical protein IX329_002450 [Fusobacterium necrophorum]|nr:hypothetical protein [Fusobacterium necrophorum]MBR8791002.1 hypothetical protein [Fusobacterium necrophorum]MBR8823936.1 hypothetical protein [Fusobacterium necrophorum]
MVFSPLPVSETNIPTPDSAVTSIVFLFFTSPVAFASIPRDDLLLTFIVSLFTAVELLSFASIPIPFFPVKVIVLLFTISDSFSANIPIDSFVFTLIIFPLTPVAFLLARIPILPLSVAAPVKVIVPVFVAFTLSFVILDSFVSIIPTEFVASIVILLLFVSANAAFVPAVPDFIFPNIAADF